MVKHFDHVTVVVNDVDAARKFFGLLGFEEDKSVVIKGGTFSQYMGIDDIEAEHVTLALAGSSPRMEIQLLKMQHPVPQTDPNIARLDKFGFNHVCFAVDDIEQEVKRLKAEGVHFLNEIMEFNNRKLTYFSGPEGITLELAQWL